VEELRDGREFVMGSRFRGSIEPGAMPRLHRYFGTPFTTWILNRLYRTELTDIHCGMRGMHIEALHRIDLRSQGWEYASEMILKAAKLRLDIAEVPVRFLKDREGRESHHKRAGWHSPWVAGWDNLKVMMLYAPEPFLIFPGIAGFAAGMLLSLLLVAGPVTVAGVGLSLNAMLFGVVLAVLGYSAAQLGVLAHAHHELDPRFNDRLTRLVTFNRGAGVAALLGTLGVVLELILVARWASSDFQLSSIDHPAVFGLLLILLAFQTFAFTLLFQIVESRRR
jgi:hypothetical protein